MIAALIQHHHYWATLYRPGDTTTIMSDLRAMCTALANACHEYAQATRDATRIATRIATGEHIAEIILLLGAGAVTGLLPGVRFRNL